MSSRILAPDRPGGRDRWCVQHQGHSRPLGPVRVTASHPEPTSGRVPLRDIAFCAQPSIVPRPKGQMTVAANLWLAVEVDENDERIALAANGATTSYPFTFYNVATSSACMATITKHIGTISDRSSLASERCVVMPSMSRSIECGTIHRGRKKWRPGNSPENILKTATAT